eukprot:GEMP01080673.1.p1 GENE.GEMP01080673.1~~GEMP01080673.1.p1  ORF type:complete len:176 (+),score=24.11 GEMP01080673.1:143-670(+)
MIRDVFTALVALRIVGSGGLPKPLPLFGVINDSNILRYQQQYKSVAWFSFDRAHFEREAAKAYDDVETVAKQFPSIGFVYYDTNALGDHCIETLGCREFPCVSLVRRLRSASSLRLTYTETFAMTSENIASFINRALTGKVPPLVPPEYETTLEWNRESAERMLEDGPDDFDDEL